MPHASHRLDLLVVAAKPDQTVDMVGVASLLATLGVDDRGYTENASRWILGGCARVWFDSPKRLILYANQSGGFRATCPQCDVNLARPFGKAHMNWKRGGPRSLSCAGCGQTVSLEDVRLNPHGAFSSWAIVFSGAEGTELTKEAKEAIRAVVGEFQVVLRRP